MSHPTLLRIHPPQACHMPEEHVVRLPVDNYQVEQVCEVWWVRIRSTGELVYAGIDPVEVVRSMAPF